jgi:hypothetical protein
MDSWTPCNIAVLCGVISDVSVRVLASGDCLATFALRVPGPQAKATSIPVVLFRPPAWLEDLAEEQQVVVVGTMQRRFFKLASGATGSSTEVLAGGVARSRETRRVTAMVRRTVETLSEFAA